MRQSWTRTFEGFTWQHRGTISKEIAVTLFAFHKLQSETSPINNHQASNVLQASNIILKTVKFIADHKSNSETSRVKYYWRTDFIVGQTSSNPSHPNVCASTLKPMASEGRSLPNHLLRESDKLLLGKARGLMLRVEISTCVSTEIKIPSSSPWPLQLTLVQLFSKLWGYQITVDCIIKS